MPRKTNIGDVAEALGISRRRVFALIEEGVLPKPRNGRHSVKACAKLYGEYRLEHDKEARIARDAAKLQANLDVGRPARWTIELAAREFRVSEAFLRRRLRETGATPA